MFLCLGELGRGSPSFCAFLFIFFFSPESIIHTKRITNNDSFSLNYLLYKIPTFLKWRFLVTILLTISFLSWMYLQLNFPESDGFGVYGVWWSFCLFLESLFHSVPLVCFSSGCVCYLLWWSVQLLSFSFSQNCLWLLAP